MVIAPFPLPIVVADPSVTLPLYVPTDELLFIKAPRLLMPVPLRVKALVLVSV